MTIELELQNDLIFKNIFKGNGLMACINYNYQIFMFVLIYNCYYNNVH